MHQVMSAAPVSRAVPMASSSQVVEAKERVIAAACAYVDEPCIHRVNDLASAVTALEALTVPKDD